MKKTLKSMAALLLVGCIVFAGCQSFDDLIPEEYGEWDNHYIYRGNVRSKTTGEDWEYLVTEVETDAHIYTVQSCADYAISGDDIYMCLTLACVGQEVLYSNAVVKYNVQNKTQETLCVYEELPNQAEGAGTAVSYYPYSIECLTEEGLLMHGRKESITYGEDGMPSENTSQTLHYLMDFEGSVIEDAAFNYSLYARANDTYWWNTEWQDNEWSLYYIAWGMQQPVFVCKKNTVEYIYKETFVEKNGAVGFLISTLEKGESGVSGKLLTKLEFYNLKTNALTTVYEGTKYVEGIEIPQDEYFVSYDYLTVEYEYRDGLFSPKKKESVATPTNCVLHQIVYSEQGVEVKAVYEFGEKKNFTDIRAVAGGKVLAHGVWYEDARGCAFGGMQQEYCEVDLSSGKLKDMDKDKFDALEDEYFGIYARQTGKTCGGYIYYLQQEKLSGGFQSVSYAYLLQRYNTKSEKTDVMQLWRADYSQEGEKCCEEMWRRTGGDLEEFIVRGY